MYDIEQEWQVDLSEKEDSKIDFPPLIHEDLVLIRGREFIYAYKKGSGQKVWQTEIGPAGLYGIFTLYEDSIIASVTRKYDARIEGMMVFYNEIVRVDFHGNILWRITFPKEDYDLKMSSNFYIKSNFLYVLSFQDVNSDRLIQIDLIKGQVDNSINLPARADGFIPFKDSFLLYYSKYFGVLASIYLYNTRDERHTILSQSKISYVFLSDKYMVVSRKEEENNYLDIHDINNDFKLTTSYPIYKPSILVSDNIVYYCIKKEDIYLVAYHLDGKQLWQTKVNESRFIYLKEVGPFIIIRYFSKRCLIDKQSGHIVAEGLRKKEFPKVFEDDYVYYPKYVYDPKENLFVKARFR